MQDGDAPETQKKILLCFRLMSRLFAEPVKAEENFQVLDQLKDVNIWKILTNLLDPNISFDQACSGRVSTSSLVDLGYDSDYLLFWKLVYMHFFFCFAG